MERKFLDEAVVRETLGCILKYQDDIDKFKQHLDNSDCFCEEFLGDDSPEKISPELSPA